MSEEFADESDAELLALIRRAEHLACDPLNPILAGMLIIALSIARV